MMRMPETRDEPGAEMVVVEVTEDRRGCALLVDVEDGRDACEGMALVGGAGECDGGGGGGGRGRHWADSWAEVGWSFTDTIDDTVAGSLPSPVDERPLTAVQLSIARKVKAAAAATEVEGVDVMMGGVVRAEVGDGMIGEGAVDRARRCLAAPTRLRPVLAPIIGVWALSMLVLIFEGDIGTSAVFMGLFVAMLYIATGRRSWAIIGFLMFIVGAFRSGRQHRRRLSRADGIRNLCESNRSIRIHDISSYCRTTVSGSRGVSVCVGDLP